MGVATRVINARGRSEVLNMAPLWALELRDGSEIRDTTVPVHRLHLGYHTRKGDQQLLWEMASGLRT
jgi:hypothetical protein